jgi:hypothetical protein
MTDDTLSIRQRFQEIEKNIKMPQPMLQLLAVASRIQPKVSGSPDARPASILAVGDFAGQSRKRLTFVSGRGWTLMDVIGTAPTGVESINADKGLAGSFKHSRHSSRQGLCRSAKALAMVGASR